MSTSSSSPEIGPVGSDAAVRAAALRGPYPGLKVCGNRLAVEQTARVVIGPADRTRVEYAAVLVTCQGATGSSPADVSIVEPYGVRLAALYRLVRAPSATAGTTCNR